MRTTLLLAVLFSMACGPNRPPCRNACNGCCDGTETCHPGTTEGACGLGGAACRACPSGQACSGQTCVTAPPRCSAANCAGCCDSSDTCRVGTSTTACGTSGATCAVCTGTQVCSTGVCRSVCSPSNCAGCCTSSNVCVSSPSNGNNATCGTAGNLCENCTLTATSCINFFCQ